MSGANVLDEILATTREDVARRRRAVPEASLEALAREPTPGAFRDALAAPGLAIIAEHKRRSPSAGTIRPGSSVSEVARAYERGGAAAMSVLTEERWFDGSLDDLRDARRACALPLLRKDFVIDPYQLAEAASAGATNPNNPFVWSGATVLKPNRREAFLAADLPYAQDEEAVLAAGAVLQKKHDIRHLLITLGEAGMLLLEQGRKPYHTPTRAREVFDVSGAGDTSIAAFTLALAAGATGIEAAEIANHAAGVVVAKLGTATLTINELREMFVKTEGLK